MAWFRRKPTGGRHALGAAVTSIPSGPLMVPPAVPAAAAPEPVASESLVSAPGIPALPGVLGVNVALVASGQAWAQAPAALPAPLAAAPGVEVPASTDAPTVGTSSARSSLDAALAQLLPMQAGEPDLPVAPMAPAVVAPRVQLGFRDGTSTSLDPTSDQSQALELLAQSLTRRD